MPSITILLRYMTQVVYLETEDLIHLMGRFHNLKEWTVSNTKLNIAFLLKIEKIRDEKIRDKPLKLMNLPIIRSLI